MKKKTIACALVFLLAVLACMNSFGDDKEKFGFYVPKPFEEICGTWINTTYSPTYYAQKFILYDWGFWEAWDNAASTSPSTYPGTYILVAKWTDTEGNIWYKEYVRERHGMNPTFELDKISKDGTVWEFVFAYNDFPKADAMNPKNPYYRIYYREQETE